MTSPGVHEDTCVSVDLTVWTATTVSGSQLVTIFPIDGPKRFFRRKSL